MVNSNFNLQVKPFLKWVGGKRWLTPALSPLLSSHSGKYVEPFVGSGAMFFSTKINKAVLSDCNSDLLSAYRTVRSRPHILIRKLNSLSISKNKYLEIRSSKPTTITDQGVRLIYLNRTAFNGLYRVNSKGEFNVPFGCKPNTTLCDQDTIITCSRKLKLATLQNLDFRISLKNIRQNDTVYLDPPYTVKHNNNAFRKYNESIFTWKDQEDLATIANRIANRGARVVVTNAYHQDVISLYDSKLFTAFAISRYSSMAANINRRGSCNELLLVSKSIISNKHSMESTIRNNYRGPLEYVDLRNEGNV